MIYRLEIPELCDGLRLNRFLRQLNLFGNLISDTAVEMLAKVFVDNHSIQILGLGSNRITEKGLLFLSNFVGGVKTHMLADAEDRIKKQKASAPAGPSKPRIICVGPVAEI